MTMGIAIILAIISGLSIPIFTALFFSSVFRMKSSLMRYVASSSAGFILWFILLAAFHAFRNNIWDLICGGLVILCAIWANYWLGNFGGGFRINMLVILAAQQKPITFEQWMDLYGNLGMDAFLRDRMRSILIPWGIVKEAQGNISLTSQQGRFFGWLMNALYFLLLGKRRG